MIDLFAGTILLGITVLLFLVLRWGSRKPQEPFWMREALVANVYTPLMVGTFAFSICYLVKSAGILGS